MKSLSYHKKLKAKGWEREELEWYLSDPGYLMMETEKIMSNKNIVYPVPFSVGFICKYHIHQAHPFIIKILWDDSPEEGYAWNGYVEGFGKYLFTKSKINPYDPTKEQLEEVKKFVEIFKVLFTAWWNGKLYSGYITDYFYGNMSFNDLKNNFEDLKKKHIEGLSRCETFQELENYVRKYKLWSLD